MSKLCEIIQDLIPVYIQGETSLFTEDVLARHISECEDCSNYYCQMFDLLTQQEKEAEQLEKWNIFRWGKSGMNWLRTHCRGILRMAAVFLGGILLAALLCGGWYGLTQIDCIPVASEDFRIVRTLQLADGDVYCEFRVRYPATFTHHYMIQENRVYFTAMRPVLDRQDRNMETYDGKWIMDPMSVWDKENQCYISVDAIYLGNPEDAVLVWSPDLKLPAATREEEAHIEAENWTIF